jgi:hypothetical protein
MTALRALDAHDAFGLPPVAVAGLAQLERGLPFWGNRLRVVHVDHEAVRLVTRTSAHLSVYRPEDGAVLAWELRAPEFRHGISANVATSVAESLTLSR